MTKTPAMKRFNFFISQQMQEQLRECAKRLGEPEAVVVRQAIREYLIAQHKKGKP